MLVCQILEIQNVRFVGNLILITAVSFMMMTSL